MVIIMKNDSFFSLIKQLDNNIIQQRDRGTMFEKLCITYLKNEPLYSKLFDDVWMLNEVPDKYGVPKIDTGVDLVAKKSGSDELTAIQCKYYSEKTTIRKAHIDSFLNEVGKKYYTDGLIITTTDKWSKNADDALNDRNKNIMRLSLSDLHNSKIDWSTFNFDNTDDVKLFSRKKPRKHQIPAIEAAIQGFEENDRGKLIMAPGTGKTYTSMAITERLAEAKKDTFKVLYLVPSIQLLSQTLKSWNADINTDMESIAVCSDRKVTKNSSSNKLEDISSVDIGFPATTNKDNLLQYMNTIENKDYDVSIITVFSTYQSIGVISEAQKDGFYNFDLVICDEAHRTTGATEINKEASAFTMVHSNNNIKANKRLYQTATPRVYGESAKKKADEKSVLIADMADEETYGKEFYRIGFGDAIRKGILTDYKVMVLAVDEKFVFKGFQEMVTQNESEIDFNDIAKIIGCWNGLVKRNGNSNYTLGQPMKRAIAFTGTIKESKMITEMFSKVVDEYLYNSANYNNPFKIDIDHADGSMNAVQKNAKIDWLKREVPENTCRVLSNARFLTEGVDVPELDAVMFLKPRKSKIDIAQAVGRVMRKAEGKDYGYIILPIGVPSSTEAHTVLDNNEKYQVVWEILNALRSIDERFDATINKLELNKKKPENIQVIGIDDAPENLESITDYQEQLAFELNEENLSDLEKAIYGKIVQKVGNVRYWEQWSKDVAEIARKHIERIQIILEDKNSQIYKEFLEFVSSLKYNINDSVTEEQAIEMLSQHLITKPVFDALFDTHSFIKNNPVSKSMEQMVSLLGEKGLMKEQDKLERFYESVKDRASNIDNLEAKQKIIIQLYDKFFKTAFKDTTDRLGIVFTPVEIVDFILNSVDEVLKLHFNKTITERDVHILDPFTGTGTFIVRLLQNNIIKKEDIVRKYTQELHANEIVLLSYYIAAINIEETYHTLYNPNTYLPYEGIVLTDTFESTEQDESFSNVLFSENNSRLNKQKNNPIFAIVGNPPYSKGQSNANDNNQNLKYSKLDQSIDDTYGKFSKAKLKRSLYDNYVRAYKWASNRISEQGIIAFISNNSFIDSQSMDGLRKIWHEEFNHIYIINLRGDQRTQGELSKKEGGKIFDSGIRAGIAIVILVKDNSKNHNINYFAVDDYMNRKQKLKLLKEYDSISKFKFKTIQPNSNYDWINLRDDSYQQLIPLVSKEHSIFNSKMTAVNTNRDAWVYNFSKKELDENCNILVENFNNEIDRLYNIEEPSRKLKLKNSNDSFIKWTDKLNKLLIKNKKITLLKDNIVESLYRPFTKKYLFYQKEIVERPGKFKDSFVIDNMAICVTGLGAKKGFSSIVTNVIPNLNMLEAGVQVFQLKLNNDTGLINYESSFNISEEVANKFGLSVTDLFYYVYAILNSNEYVEKYKNNLRKELPRIPLVKHSSEFVKIGKELVYLHLNYDQFENISFENVIFNTENPSYEVNKMKFEDKNKKDTILFNDDIKIINIPEIAYEYIISGRSAIEWIIDQYQIKYDRKSKIIDNPNNFSKDPKYILKLILSIIDISIRTREKINNLPKFEEI